MPRVSIESKKAYEALDWIKLNCPSYITNRVDMVHLTDEKRIGPIKFSFVFGDEKDATMFALRWT